MKRRLKRSICNLDDYAILGEVKDMPARREARIGSSLDYAYRFWTKHLSGIPRNWPHVKRVQDAIDEFFATRLLHWIEVLSIMRHLGVAVYAIDDIRQWYVSVSHT